MKKKTTLIPVIENSNHFRNDVEEATDISESFLHRISKKNRFPGYQVQLHQTLSRTDFHNGIS